MESPFRTVKDWEAAIMMLPDKAFFDLMRSVLGNIRTPFTKQRLIDEVAAFLSNEKNQKVLESYLDEKDSLVIAAIAVMGCPSVQELTNFLGQEIRDINTVLINMEERLLVYRFRKNGLSYMALNPFLEPVLKKRTESARLFPSKVRLESAGCRRLDDRIIAAAVAFVLEKERVFKTNEELRKSILEAGSELFPGFSLKNLLGAMQVLSLLRADGERVAANDPGLRAFAGLSPKDRLEYFAAGLYVFQNRAGIFEQQDAPNYFQQSQLRTIAAFIHQFLDFFDENRAYPRLTVERLAVLLQQRGLGSNQDKSVSLPNLEQLLSVLENLGVLETTEPMFWQIGAALPQSPNGEETPVIAMDTDFSFVLFPEISFTDALTLAAFSLPRDTGTTVRFEMSRESVVRGFDKHIDAGKMLALLNRLSCNQLSPVLEFSLRDWEKRYREVSLHQGLVLCLAEDRRFLAEAGPLSAFIERVLAPGVYLLSVSERDDAVRALERAGVDIIAQAAKRSASERAAAFPVLAAGQALVGLGSGGAETGQSALAEQAAWAGQAGRLQAEQAGLAAQAGLAYKAHFREVLQGLKISKQEQEELAAHIERHLILNESQLRADCVRGEKLEAHLLDYSGKEAVARAALATASTVDVCYLNNQKPGRREIQVSGLPKGIEKADNDAILLLDAGGEILRVPLRKIRLIRKIKKSIFE